MDTRDPTDRPFGSPRGVGRAEVTRWVMSTTPGAVDTGAAPPRSDRGWADEPGEPRHRGGPATHDAVRAPRAAARRGPRGVRRPRLPRRGHGRDRRARGGQQARALPA